MNEEWLGKKLKSMYEEAKINDASCQIHLFGIIYADVIKQNEYSLKEILNISGISKGYLSELSKGIKLSKYVVLKDNV